LDYACEGVYGPGAVKSPSYLEASAARGGMAGPKSSALRNIQDILAPDLGYLLIESFDGHDIAGNRPNGQRIAPHGQTRSAGPRQDKCNRHIHLWVDQKEAAPG